MKSISIHRNDVDDGATLNMLVMEMDEILRDRPDDEDGANHCTRVQFLGAIRDGVFNDLLFAQNEVRSAQAPGH
jgi:hypothetical protein